MSGRPNTVAKKGFKQSAAQARKLLARRTLSPSVADTTIEDYRYADRKVVMVRAHELTIIGGVVIPQDEQFFLVYSKTSCVRFYAVYQVSKTEWITSCKDDSWSGFTVRAAQKYRQFLCDKRDAEMSVQTTIVDTLALV